MTTDAAPAGPAADPFADPAAFAALPRVTALATSAAGRVVAAVESPDEGGADYRSALWELDAGGAESPRRITWSDEGESAPAFLADDTLVFVSARVDDQAAVWALPAGGEARRLASYPGGARGPVPAGASPVLLASADRPVAAVGDGDDARRRRKDRKVTAILHTGMPVRHWDHEVGDVAPRLLLARDGAAPLDLAPDAVFELADASYDLSSDGSTAVTTWTRRLPGGRTQTALAVIDVVTRERRLVEPDGDDSFSGCRLSPDGTRVATIRESEGSFEEPMAVGVQILDATGGAGHPVDAETGEAFPLELCWSGDGRTLYVAGDWRGRGAVLAIDGRDGSLLRRLACDASYTCLRTGPGGTLYALRSAVDSPPAPVRLDPDATDQDPQPLLSPCPAPALPGTLEELHATAPDGAALRAWLCLPRGDGPAPVMLWIHGGPFSSWNSWSWRWNPWVAVAHGWAVVLADPALSTGYGPGWWARAWPHRAGPVWADLEAVLDAALARDDLDAGRTACLGGSFGGYMTNWVAGHTDRFAAIVTHAGLWALDQQHATTDAAAWKTRLFGTPVEHPEWYAANSPNQAADAVTTPMLIVHGTRDYRVPVSEALRLWWDLTSRFGGPPDDLPHRFLQFTGENHWISSPANAEIWYATVLGFCAQHVLGAPPSRSPLL